MFLLFWNNQVINCQSFTSKKRSWNALHPKYLPKSNLETTYFMIKNLHVLEYKKDQDFKQNIIILTVIIHLQMLKIYYWGFLWKLLKSGLTSKIDCHFEIEVAPFPWLNNVILDTHFHLLCSYWISFLGLRSIFLCDPFDTGSFRRWRSQTNRIRSSCKNCWCRRTDRTLSTTKIYNNRIK
jgi:hypothetical protein